jgi:phosphatidate cytidylyltransferase
MNNLSQRTISGVVFVLIVLGAILLSDYSMMALTLIVFSLAFYELKQMFRIKGRMHFALTFVAGIASLVMAFLMFSRSLNPEIPLISLIGYVTILACWYLFFKKTSISELGILLFGHLWIGGSLILFLGLGWIEAGETYEPLLIILLLVFTWVNDVAAYLAGTFLGKRPLAPAVSPGKTWEGFLSGVVLTILAGYFFFLITEERTALFWMAGGAIVSLGSAAGDLFESKMKREADVKDSGNLIPGHGGILDRFDSLIFSAPLFYLLFLIW